MCRTPSKYINPFMDSSFKRLFGVEESKSYLISFLNELFREEMEIEDIDFVNKEITPEFDYEKMMIYDVYCKTSKGEHIIIEMQNKVTSVFKDRTLFYLIDALHRQGRSGQRWSYDIKSVYGVFFINEKMDEVDKLVKHIGLSDLETGEPFSGKLRLTYISLPHMTKKPEECTTALDKWLYVFKNLEELDMIPFKDQLKGLVEFEARAKYSSMTERERDIYERNLKIYRDNLMIMTDAVRRGEEKGMEKGMEKGIEKGIEKGMIKAAKKFIESGMSRLQVKKILGLSDADMALL